MLEIFLQKSRGFVLAAIVVLLSAVFILQFGGPQAQGCSGSGGVSAVAEVYGEPISAAEARAAFLMVGGDRYPAELAKQNKLQEMVLHGLIEESLLAREAAELGFQVTDDDVMEQVIEDGLIYVPMSVEASMYLPPAGPRRYDFNDKDGSFSKDNLKRFIQGGLQRSIRDFTEQQVRATLAQRMRENVLASVQVGSGEVWDSYVREQESATISYVRFAPSYFEQSLEFTDADIDTFIAEQADALEKAYQAQKHRYTGLEKQVRARHILVKVAATASEEDKSAARARAQALLDRAKAGEDFAQLARENSEDTGSAKKGGDLGFNPKGRMVAPFDEAQFSMAVGDISELVESTFGLHVINVTAIREGDVPVDEAKREIALKLYKEQHGKTLAKDAADAALAALKAGGSTDEVGKNLPGAAPEGEARDPLAPQFLTSRPFGRTDAPVAGPFDGVPLAQAAYGLELDAPLPDAPIQLGAEYVVFKLTDKTVAKKEDFTTEEQDRLRQAVLNKKRIATLSNYVRELKRKAQAEKAILVEDAQSDDTAPTGAG